MLFIFLLSTLVMVVKQEYTYDIGNSYVPANPDGGVHHNEGYAHQHTEHYIDEIIR